MLDRYRTGGTKMEGHNDNVKDKSVKTDSFDFDESSLNLVNNRCYDRFHFGSVFLDLTDIFEPIPFVNLINLTKRQIIFVQFQS